MKIKLIDFNGPAPVRAHDNDAGADVFSPRDQTIYPGQVYKLPLGFGLELPDGYVGYIFPRSSLSARGIVCELPPIDSGYRGEVHAEQNAIISAPRRSMRGATLYLACLDDTIDPAPCNICDRMIKNAGITRVVTRAGTF